MACCFGVKEITWQLNALLCLQGNFFRHSSYLLSSWGIIYVFSFSVHEFSPSLFAFTKNKSVFFCFTVIFSELSISPKVS